MGWLNSSREVTMSVGTTLSVVEPGGRAIAEECGRTGGRVPSSDPGQFSRVKVKHHSLL